MSGEFQDQQDLWSNQEDAGGEQGGEDPGESVPAEGKTHEPEEVVTERRRSRSGVTTSSGESDDMASAQAPRSEEPGSPPVSSDSEAVDRSRREAAPERLVPKEPLEPDEEPISLPRLGPPRRRGRRLVKKEEEVTRTTLSPPQRLLLLDTWRRSGLPARDFAALVGVSRHTLYAWKKRFKQQGPAGLMDQPRGGPRGSRLPELTKRAILMLKEEHPDWGCQRISDMLLRGPALAASPSAVARVLHEAGYEYEEVTTKKHPDRVRRFERAKPNQLWQTDLFTFVLKRQNRRLYLVAFLDDHSRFITGWGVHSTQSAALVLEVLRSAITSYNPPEEILSDNGSQYVTWRGRSAFSKELDRRGIRHVVSSPRRPQTLGKIERCWGSLWREFLELAIFTDLEDARRRIGSYMDYYNFRRPHQGIDGLAPADRFFSAAPKVLEMLKRRVADNALELARQGTPRRPFYLTGQAGGKSFSVHAEGERVILQREEGEREEVELVAPKKREPEATSAEPALTPEGHPADHGAEDEERTPGSSPLDDLLAEFAEHREVEEPQEEGDAS